MKAHGCTVIIVAHGPNVLQVADKLLMLRDGQLVVYGPRDKALAYLREQAEKEQGRKVSVPGPAAGPAVAAAPA